MTSEILNKDKEKSIPVFIFETMIGPSISLFWGGGGAKKGC